LSAAVSNRLHRSQRKATALVRTRTRIGPYSRHGAVAKLDGRSREALFLKRRRVELVAHCGGAPTATQQAHIERACWLALRIAQLDEKLAAGTLTEHDTRAYLAWTNTHRLIMRELGPAAAAKSPTLADYIASKKAATTPSGVP
jgi:hypothetical protein